MGLVLNCAAVLPDITGETTMGVLLSFRSRRRPAAPEHADARGPAQVLFFTGVRYERQRVEKPRKVRKRRTVKDQRTA